MGSREGSQAPGCKKINADLQSKSSKINHALIQSFLRKYETHEPKRGMQNNTVNSSFKWFGRVLGYAKKDGMIELMRTLSTTTAYRLIPSERMFLE